MKVGGTSANNIDVWEFADETEADAEAKGLQEVTSNVYGNRHTALYADMVDAIDNDRAPYVDAVAGRNALEIVLAIYKSQKTGEPVKLPLRVLRRPIWPASSTTSKEQSCLSSSTSRP